MFTHPRYQYNMSKKQGSHSGLPKGLPDDFFDSDKKGKKEQEDELAKELEQFEREMAALQAEADENIRDEFDKLQDERNLDELDQQIDQWKRIVELEKKAEDLKSKHQVVESPTKKFKGEKFEFDLQRPSKSDSKISDETDSVDLDDIEDFEDKLSNWRSKRL